MTTEAATARAPTYTWGHVLAVRAAFADRPTPALERLDCAVGREIGPYFNPQALDPSDPLPPAVDAVYRKLVVRTPAGIIPVTDALRAAGYVE